MDDATGDLVSTHSGNPVCCRALFENIKILRDEKLVESAAAMGEVIYDYADKWDVYHGCGLAWSIWLGTDPNHLDIARAKRIVKAALGRGLLLLDTGRGTIKIAPPLCITKDELLSGLGIITDCLREVS